MKYLHSSLQIRIVYLKKNLGKSESQQSEKWLKELSNQLPECSLELKAYWKHGDFSAIIMKRDRIMRETKHIGDLLKEELGKNGKSIEWLEENLQKKRIQL